MGKKRHHLSPDEVDAIARYGAVALSHIPAQRTPAPPADPDGIWTFRPDVLHRYLDDRRYARRSGPVPITWWEAAREIMPDRPNRAMREIHALEVGHWPNLEVLIRMLQWLGTTDLYPYLMVDTAGWS